MNSPIRFSIVGSGWRSLYYVRIAKAMPDVFRLCGMLCRSAEKAEKISEAYGIPTFTSEEDMLREKPDFIVVAVDKAHVAEVSIHYLDLGCPVLSETPTALDKETVVKLWEYHKKGAKLIIAEQYRNYPLHHARKQLIEKGYIGTPNYLYLSEAHEYHGVSLMRMYLNLNPEVHYRISARSYPFPVTETLSRYEAYADGRIAEKKRTLATFTFENGSVCLYDFDSEQYRSKIRYNTLRVLGERGEIFGNRIRYLNEENAAEEKELNVSYSISETDESNPNLHTVKEITQIRLDDQILYEPLFGIRHLAEDETAIATLLYRMGKYVLDQGEEPYPLIEALSDAYAAILLKEAIATGREISFEDILK
ncbi:MAG: Gfo/Idh/MocA family oxidoreductase [Erysipelotrichaceae bacterium]|nr:Gfo/Idh/MocA family oxidoreductase [Erysipelotrichaceae bacterium]